MKDYSKYSDLDLLPFIQEGKSACDGAFYELYKRYSAKLNAYCRFSTNEVNHSDEIFQETWIRFDKSVKAGNNISNVLPYLISIAKNLIIYKANIYNFRKQFVISMNDEVLDNFHSYIDITEYSDNSELSDLLNNAVDLLDDIYKEAFVLRKFDGLSYQDISKITNESIDCIKKRVTRATIKIKEILKPYINELK